MDYVEHHGARIAYDDAGSGDPPLVFVHGWCCNRSFQAPQFEHFASRHRVVALDLRGHGDSDRPEAPYTIASHADDVAYVCRELDLRKPVVVGHSMGGAIALSLAARHADLPAGIVMLDGALFFPEPLLAHLVQISVALRSPQYLELLRGFCGGMFMESDDPVRKQQIIDAMCATAQHVVVGGVEAMAAYDATADARVLAAPAMYVGSAGPVADMTRVEASMPQVLRAQTAGAGHFHQLEVPEQINAMLDRFFQIVRASR